MFSTDCALIESWCERGDSNPHGFPRQILSLVRLPIPPLSHGQNQRFATCALIREMTAVGCDAADRARCAYLDCRTIRRLTSSANINASHMSNSERKALHRKN